MASNLKKNNANFDYFFLPLYPFVEKCSLVPVMVTNWLQAIIYAYGDTVY